MDDDHLPDNGGTLIPLSRLDAFLAIAIVALLFFATAMTLRPFFPALLWAIILAIAAAPLHARLVHGMPGWPRLAAAIVSLLLTLIIVVPALALTQAIVTYSPTILAWFDQVAGKGLPEAPESITSLPWVGTTLGDNWQTISGYISGYIAHFKEDLEGWAVWVLHQMETAGAFVLEFLLATILAGVFLAHRRQYATFANAFFQRIGGATGTQILIKSVIATRSTVRGVVGAAAAQALVALFAYVIAGVPAWPLITGLTFLAALTQIGSFLVWVPVALWLVVEDRLGWGIFLLLWGTFVLHGVDNIIRPLLVSKGSNLPFLLVFLGVLGGLIAWGLIGVFLGPVILAVAFEVIREWSHAEHLDRLDPEIDRDEESGPQV